MKYLLEQLGPERFQQLAQALLLKERPNLQCLPVAQPDGGRDAFEYEGKNAGSGFLIYQVKFVKDPDTKNARDSIREFIRLEKSKVAKLIKKGAVSYCLVTNVSGTSHLDVGSIDLVNQELEIAFGIPAQCWWRDDIERRIDDSTGIKWSYPEILKATDVIGVLLENDLSSEERRRTDAIRAYMAFQAQTDAQLKFKQVELQKDIIDLFVDVPAHMVLPPGADEVSHSRTWREFVANNKIDCLEPDSEPDFRRRPTGGALAFLANERFSEDVSKLVVEGAPGQGKSTVTQFLCQVHRLLLLGKSAAISRIQKKHRPTSVRIPFRVDLRDYASWLTGRDPFSEDGKSREDMNPVLEAFISAQVSRYTGSSFSADDLAAVYRKSRILVVLDGFDEVADVKVRNKIVSEVTQAEVRMSANAVSLQIVVTSRPTAFTNSPGFSREEWPHMEILPLTTQVVEEYANKWLHGRGCDPREKKEILSVLQQKLEQPHVRELSRNPMQLAILLSLIMVQGASLPNRRTALYDKYIDIFLNRESEKSQIVRDYRDLLVNIHRYLAWVLQSEAEKSGSGNVSETRLKSLLRDYLEKSDRDPALVETIFGGMIERVVALVSRVQGTYEFEVQPLREYFAARYLYDTAPYAPPGVRVSGTLPDRFLAISRNFYWLNVTRFYAGCYSTGELPSLIDGIEQLSSDNQFGVIGYTSNLGCTLLGDYIFSEQPRYSSKLSKIITSGESLRVHLAEVESKRSFESMALPSGSGRREMFDYAFNLMSKSGSYDVGMIASRLARDNGERKDIESLWRKMREEMKGDSMWMVMGSLLGVFRGASKEDAETIVSQLGPACLIYFIRAGRVDVIDDVFGGWDLLCDRIIIGDIYGIHGVEIAIESARYTFLTRLSLMLWQYTLERASNEKGSLFRRIVDRPARKGEKKGGGGGGELPQEWQSIASKMESVLKVKISNVLSDHSFYSEFLEAVRDKWGNGWAVYSTAVAYANVYSGDDSFDFDLCDDKYSVCERAISARKNAGGEDWLVRQLDGVENKDEVAVGFLMSCVFSWVPISALVRYSSRLSEVLDGLSDPVWLNVQNVFMHRMFVRKIEVGKLSKADMPLGASCRFYGLLLPRLRDGSKKVLLRTVMNEYDGGDRIVWRHIVDQELALLAGKGGNWGTLVPSVRKAYLHKYVAQIYPMGTEIWSGMPPELAKSICEEAGSYPMGLVAGASFSLTRKIGLETRAVADIAETDGWFKEIPCG